MFGLVIPSRPVLAPPSLQIISQTQYAYTFPSAPSFSHLVVFLLPGNELPHDVAAAIYIRFPGTPANPNLEFKLLGAIGMDKQSAIFKVNGNGMGTNTVPGSGTGAVIGQVNGVAEVDMDADEPQADPDNSSEAIGEITLGISIEPMATIAPQLAALEQARRQNAALSMASDGAMTVYKRPGAAPIAKVLAQRIIKNAFNFLASFAGGDEMVPLKSFEGWWKKFERRIEADPGFLERDEEG